MATGGSKYFTGGAVYFTGGAVYFLKAKKTENPCGIGVLSVSRHPLII